MKTQTKKQPINFAAKLKKPRKKRPHIHSKRKASRCKQSKNYLKRTRGQNSGRK